MPRVTLHPEQLEALARERNAGLNTLDAGPRRQGDLPPERDEADSYRTRALELQAADQLQQLADSVRQQRGFASASALADARRAIDAMRVDLLRNAPNSAARETLGPAFDRHAQIVDHDLTEHVEREKLGARLDLSRQRQALAEQDAIAATSPLAFQAHAQTAADEMDEQARLTGQSVEGAEAAKTRMLSGLEQARLGANLKEPLLDRHGPALDPARVGQINERNSIGKAGPGERKDFFESEPSLASVPAVQLDTGDYDLTEVGSAPNGRAKETSVAEVPKTMATDSGDAIYEDKIIGTASPALLALPISFSRDPLNRSTSKSYIRLDTGMPPFPPVRKFDGGSGKYNTEKPTAEDVRFRNEMRIKADGGWLLGYSEASRNLTHFLERSGTTLDVDVLAMYRDMKQFRDSIVTEYRQKVKNEINSFVSDEYKGNKMQFAFVPREWSSSEAYGIKGVDYNWFLAMGKFDFNFTSRVTVTPQRDGLMRVDIDSILHVYDRYDWNTGKTAKMPNGETIYDNNMARLHRVGLGQDFEIRGSAPVRHVTYFYRPKQSAQN